LQREHTKHLEREKAVGLILDTLRTGYNPNYQDMAILEAVRGWEELTGLPHINDVGKDKEGGNKDETVKEETNSEDDEPLEEGMWTADQLQYQLDALLSTDYVSLLLEHEKFIQPRSMDPSVRVIRI
jgi:protein kinase C substrate 80K-H